MFFTDDKDKSWAFRFTGTKPGTWSFVTSSQDQDLDGHTGKAMIRTNPRANAHGFLKQFDGKWAWDGTENVFVPQLVMWDYIAGARICAACHQPDGSGMNGLLAANFVTDKSRLAKSNEVLLNSIRNGIVADNKVMPPQKGILTEQEMKDALSYIRKTFGDS